MLYACYSVDLGFRGMFDILRSMCGFRFGGTFHMCVGLGLGLEQERKSVKCVLYLCKCVAEIIR